MYLLPGRVWWMCQGGTCTSLYLLLVLLHPSILLSWSLPEFLSGLSCKQLSYLAFLNSLHIYTHIHTHSNISHQCFRRRAEYQPVLTYLHPAAPAPLKPQQQHQWFISQCFSKMHDSSVDRGGGRGRGGRRGQRRRGKHVDEWRKKGKKRETKRSRRTWRRDENGNRELRKDKSTVVVE